jgi:hypothetical protein
MVLIFKFVLFDGGRNAEKITPQKDPRSMSKARPQSPPPYSPNSLFPSKLSYSECHLALSQKDLKEF